MKQRDYSILRPLSAESSVKFMQLQARVSRIVGTHPGSPIRLFPIECLGVNLVSDTRTSKTHLYSGLSRGFFNTLVQESLPISMYGPATAEVEDIIVSKPERGNILYVRLGSITLQSETRSLDESLRMIADSTHDLKKFNHAIPVAHIDPTYTQEIRDYAEDFFDLTGDSTKIQLKPARVLGKPLHLSPAILAKAV